MIDALEAWAEIDLDAIAQNLRACQRHIGPDVQIIAAVKGNAYGHGLIPVSLALEAAGASRLAVHRPLEGAELRCSGVAIPILVMGHVPGSGAEQVIAHSLEAAVIDAGFARALSAVAGAAGATARVHVKVDTGMNRFGVVPEDVIPLLDSITRLPHLAVEGIFTHLATADSSNPRYLEQQLEVFRAVLGSVHAAGYEIPVVHAANSAAAMHWPESHFNAVRPGIALYGLDPSDEWPPTYPIVPALALKARVSRVWDVPPGSGVGYGRSFVAHHGIRAALIPLGYGDGYHRILSNRSHVLIRGERAGVIGRICMDQFVVDVSGIPRVTPGDEAVLLGRQGDRQIRAEELAVLAETNNYEITTSLLPRVTRIYYRAGRRFASETLGRIVWDRPSLSAGSE